MSGASLGAALALVAIPLAGLPYALCLRLRGALLASASWLLGSGLIAAAMLLASILGITYSRASLGLILLAIIALGIALLHRNSDRKSTSTIVSATLVWLRSFDLRDFPAISLLMLVVCAFQVLYTFLQAVRVPLGSFDSWSLWAFKGRRFWLDGGITAGFLHDHAIVFAHPGYPPLLPLLIAWVYTWAGTPDPTLMKPLYSLFYLALLLAFYAAVQTRLGPRWALLATAALTLVPRLTEYAGTGLADVPLASYLVAAAASAVIALRASDRRAMLAAGILLSLAMLTKREGTLFFLAALCALALIERSLGRLARWVWPALLIGLPWYGYAGSTGIPDRDFLPATPATILAHADRLGGIARLFVLNTLALDEWSVLWFAFGAVLLLAVLHRRLRAPALLAPIAIPLCLYVVSLSISAWPDPDLHVRTSLDRLILVTVPFALWFVCEQFLPPEPYQPTAA